MTRSRRTSDEGASALEFALVLPLLLLLVFGTIQFGLIFNQWQQLEHATREGARWASLRNGAADVRSTVIAAAPTLGLTPADITISRDPVTAVHGTPITVSAQVRVPVFTPGLFPGLGTSVTLRGSATQRVE